MPVLLGIVSAQLFSHLTVASLSVSAVFYCILFVAWRARVNETQRTWKQAPSRVKSELLRSAGYAALAYQAGGNVKGLRAEATAIAAMSCSESLLGPGVTSKFYRDDSTDAQAWVFADEERVWVAFCGTNSWLDCWLNLDISMTKWGGGGKAAPKVHGGFLKQFDALKDEGLEEYVKEED